MMNFSTIAFSKGFLFVPNSEVNSSDSNMEFLMSIEDIPSAIVSMQAEVMRYGYMFDADSLRALMSLNDDEIDTLAGELGEYLADAYGDGKFVSLFGNFPERRLAMSEREVLIHQIIHYLSDGAYAPHLFADAELEEDDLELARMNYEKCLCESYKMIKLANAYTLVTLFKNICNAQQSLTSYDKDVVVYFCNNYEKLGVSLEEIAPEEIPFKETLCLVAANLNGYKLTTATDVLRLAVYMSGGDIALPAIPKVKRSGWGSSSWHRMMGSVMDRAVDKTPYNFKKFNRAERRHLLALLENIFDNVSNADNVIADMKRYINKWIRLGEVLHPGEYKDKYPHTAEAFYMLRDCAKYIYTYNSRVNRAREAKDLNLLLSTLCERPGEFARNIDWVLRKNLNDTEKILNSFESVVDNVSTKVIYELIEHYYHRNDGESLSERYVFTKGSREAFKLKELPELDETAVNRLMDILVSSLKYRFSIKESLEGKKYILDNSLENITLPKNMRSMNFAPGQQARGTKIKISTNTGLLRMYCRWMDPHGQIDLDLSCTGLDEDFGHVFTMSWNGDRRLRGADGQTVAIFSGDVRHRVGNSAEYIDVDVNEMQKMGVRYLVGDVRDFDGDGFLSKDAWAGVMERSEFGTPGETTWAPDTISCGFRLTSACTNIIMTVIDLKEMVMYVVDEDLAGIPVATCNAPIAIAKRYATMNNYFNVLSLISLNLASRGAEVVKVDHEEYENTMKNIAYAKGELLKMREELNKLAEAVDEDAVAKIAIEKRLANINDKLEELNAVTGVSYDDIATDYTSILGWMF